MGPPDTHGTTRPGGCPSRLLRESLLFEDAGRSGLDLARRPVPAHRLAGLVGQVAHVADEGGVVAETHVLDRLAAGADRLDPVADVGARRVLIVRLVLDGLGARGPVERREAVAEVHELLEARRRGLRPRARRVAEVLGARLVETLERGAGVLERAFAAVDG